MPVELHLSSECQADPSLPSDVQAFASSLAGFIERASARYQGTHHLRPDPRRVHEPRLRGTSVKPTDVQQDAPSAGAVDTAQMVTGAAADASMVAGSEGIASSVVTTDVQCLASGAASAPQTETGLDAAGAGAVAQDLNGSGEQVLQPPPRPRWRSRTINEILERRRRAEESRGTSWCQALPHDAVPGPLVAALLDEWLPARAVAATDAQVFAAADRLEVLRPTAAAMMDIGRQKGAIHVDSLTLKPATQLTYDTLRAAAAYLPQVTSLTIESVSGAYNLPDKLGDHLSVFPCLRTLVLEECIVGDRHLHHIWRCEKLESVRIGSNPYYPAKSHVSVRHLTRCPALTSLHDELFDRKTSVQEVLDLLGQHSPGMTSLGLKFWRVPFVDPTVGSAFTQLTLLQSLSLQGWHFLDALVPYLVHCRVLESIKFIDAHGLTPSGLAELFKLPALTSLGLVGLTLRNCILEASLAALNDSTPSLRALDVSQSYVSDGGIRAVLQRCPAVNHITAQECQLLGGGLEEEARTRGVTFTSKRH